MKLSDAVISPAVALCVAASGGLVWLLRFLFTNQKKIAVLEERYSDIKDMLKEMRDDQKEMRRDLHNLARK